MKIAYEMHIVSKIDDEHISIDITEEDINDDVNVPMKKGRIEWYQSWCNKPTVICNQCN